MRLPLFIRRIICLRKMWVNPEYGGMLVNWNRGKWDVLHEWKDDKGLESAWEMVENHYGSGRDEIYVAAVKMGVQRGYFCIHAPGHFGFPYAFWDNIITPAEALLAVSKRCKEIGKKMGYVVEERDAQAKN